VPGTHGNVGNVELDNLVERVLAEDRHLEIRVSGVIALNEVGTGDIVVGQSLCILEIVGYFNLYDLLNDQNVRRHILAGHPEIRRLGVDYVVYLINCIFAGGPWSVPYESGDVNCSGGVDIDDVVYLINYIFSGGLAPCADCLKRGLENRKEQIQNSIDVVPSIKKGN